VRPDDVGRGENGKSDTWRIPVAMPAPLSDAQIARLIAEPKPGIDERALLSGMNPDANQHKRSSLQVRGKHGSEFALYVRQNALDAFDFSVILAYTGGGRPINLLRYNGPNHPHVNKIEGTRVDFVPHIHVASHRYQEHAYDPEGFAEETDAYTDLGGALRCMVMDAGFDPPDAPTMI